MEINVNINIQNLEQIINLLKSTTKSNSLSINKEKKAQNRSIEDIKEILSQLAKNRKTDEAQEIFKKHGAKNISDIPKEQINNIYTELININ